MKKQAGILLASMTAMALMTGCGQKEEPKPAAATEAQTTARQTEAETTEAETEETTKEEAAAETEEKKEETAGAGGCKTGLAIVSSMTSSKDAGDADGLAQVDSVAVAVVVDEEGKIVSCKLDTAQNKMGFTSEGKGVNKDDFQTNKELKEE